MTKLIIALMMSMFFLFQTQTKIPKKLQAFETMYGKAEHIEVSSNTEQNAQRWWYFSRGKCFCFKWRAAVEDGVEITTFEFKPVENVDESTLDSLKAYAKQCNFQLMTF